MNMIQKAQEFATLMHQDQKRKEGIPYITHPAGVVQILKEVFQTWPLPDPPLPDPPEKDNIISLAWLHDTLEDTIAEYEGLEKEFGKGTADRVYILSRNVDREAYKKRIQNSDYMVKIVKLADTLHNIHNPYSLYHLSFKSIQRKIIDCRTFYIPLAMDICPYIGYKLKESINNYLEIFGGMKNERG